MTALPQTTALARETKLLPAPIVAVGQDGVFEGYASLFGVPDLGKDVVSPGAFAESLARRGVAGVRLLFQHDPAAPLGRWLSIAEDARGLRVRGKLNLAVARAREIHALLREGAIDGLSIGFRVERARNERSTGLRRLEKLDLWEISIVTFPMHPGARVSGVKRENPLPLAGRGQGVGVAARALHQTRELPCTHLAAQASKIGVWPNHPHRARPLGRVDPPRKGEGRHLAALIRSATRRLFG